jgi:hypothetical protein
MLAQPGPTSARTWALRSRVTAAHTHASARSPLATINLVSRLPPARDERGNRLRGGLMRFLGHLGIDVHRERSSRMAEHLADHLGVHMGKEPLIVFGRAAQTPFGPSSASEKAHLGSSILAAL